MKVITSASVFLVGRQQVDKPELDRFLKHHGVDTWETDTEIAGQVLTEVAGRLCYMSFAKPRPGGHDAYAANIILSGHGSVLEHAVFNLIFTGVSRSFTHELVRHRAGFGYSQLSQRYVDESIAEFVVPEVIWKSQNREIYSTWLNACNDAQKAYVKLVYQLLMEEPCPACKGPLQYEFSEENPNVMTCWNCGHKLTTEQRTAARKNVRQAARSVLPNATETKIFVTANARALRHFLGLRGNKHAEPEIRAVAHTTWEIMLKECPSFFKDITLVDGELKTEFKKV